jgi:hypothetical protein
MGENTRESAAQEPGSSRLKEQAVWGKVSIGFGLYPLLTLKLTYGDALNEKKARRMRRKLG